MRRMATWRRALLTSTVLAAFLLAGNALPSFGSDFMMKGPGETVREPERAEALQTSSVSIAMLGLIGIYQRYVSPLGGVDRCGFRPSCSAYGRQAILDQGPVVGVIMIGDRMTRCNIFERRGYLRLPNGKRYDPVSDNRLFEK
ncbi:MAG: putative membrane protein insertion efficiency factor [Syntrophaceae bacterium PtaU1.Bin231]|nr:MAG: putative membrane protein insertion efficiency factor [Syntrophaceae bacterium PtaU1.Bin231]